MEESLSDPSIQDLTGLESYKITYQLVEAGTQRVKTKLVDSDGYSYNVKLRRANATYWQCTVYYIELIQLNSWNLPTLFSFKLGYKYRQFSCNFKFKYQIKCFPVS